MKVFSWVPDDYGFSASFLQYLLTHYIHVRMKEISVFFSEELMLLNCGVGEDS